MGLIAAVSIFYLFIDYESICGATLISLSLSVPSTAVCHIFGDPHVNVFGTSPYSFNAMGDFVLARSLIDDSMQVFGKFGSCFHNGADTCLLALGAKLGAEQEEFIVTFDSPDSLHMVYNDSVIILPAATDDNAGTTIIATPGKVLVQGNQKGLNFILNDGTRIRASIQDSGTMHWMSALIGVNYLTSWNNVAGLCALFHDVPKYDLMSPDTSLLINPTDAQIEDWTTQCTSLLRVCVYYEIVSIVPN